MAAGTLITAKCPAFNSVTHLVSNARGAAGTLIPAKCLAFNFVTHLVSNARGAAGTLITAKCPGLQFRDSSCIKCPRGGRDTNNCQMPGLQFRDSSCIKCLRFAGCTTLGPAYRYSATVYGYEIESMLIRQCGKSLKNKEAYIRYMSFMTYDTDCLNPL